MGASPELIVGFIDANGTVKVAPRFAGAGHFCEGKASVVDAGGRAGFLDLSEARKDGHLYPTTEKRSA